LQETINFNDGSSSKSFQVVDKQSHLSEMRERKKKNVVNEEGRR